MYIYPLKIKNIVKRIKTEILFKLSNLNSNLALTLGYLNLALNNLAQGKYYLHLFHTLFTAFCHSPGSSLLRGGAGWMCEWLIVSVLKIEYYFNLHAAMKN